MRILHPDAPFLPAIPGCSLQRSPVGATRPVLEVCIPLHGEFLHRREGQRCQHLLALVRLCPVAGAVGHHHVVLHPPVGVEFAPGGQPEIARGSELVQVQRGLLYGAVPPGLLQAVPGRRRRDPQHYLVSAVAPLHIGVLHHRGHLAAGGEVAGLVHLGAQPYRPPFGNLLIKREINTPEPEAVALFQVRIVAGGHIVIVTEHIAAESGALGPGGLRAEQHHHQKQQWSKQRRLG